MIDLFIKLLGYIFMTMCSLALFVLMLIIVGIIRGLIFGVPTA